MPRRYPNRSEVRPGPQHPRVPGTYQVRPERAKETAGFSEEDIEVVHTGGGWYEVRVEGEVYEDSLRKDDAHDIKNELLGKSNAD